MACCSKRNICPFFEGKLSCFKGFVFQLYFFSHNDNSFQLTTGQHPRTYSGRGIFHSVPEIVVLVLLFILCFGEKGWGLGYSRLHVSASIFSKKKRSCKKKKEKKKRKNTRCQILPLRPPSALTCEKVNIATKKKKYGGKGVFKIAFLPSLEIF